MLVFLISNASKQCQQSKWCSKKNGVKENGLKNDYVERGARWTLWQIDKTNVCGFWNDDGKH